MNVLIACEESQTVCLAFRQFGVNAYSCDIQSCSGGYPQYHFLCDVKQVLYPPFSHETQSGNIVYIDKWDLVIAHPPCTYLSNAGSCYLCDSNGRVKDLQRWYNGLAARDFFLMFFDLDCPFCIENPKPSRIWHLPFHSQVIQPYYFGHPFQKRTYLWLNKLPPLFYTLICDSPESTKTAEWFNRGPNRQKNRSKTFSGVGAAMASQWIPFLLSNGDLHEH